MDSIAFGGLRHNNRFPAPPPKPPGPPPGAMVTVVIAIAPTTGSTVGGDHVVIEVSDSSGCTSATIGSYSLSAFAIDDATHVSGDTHLQAAGTYDVTVTNVAGTSAPLVAAFTYAVPVVVTSIDKAYSDTLGGRTRRIVGSGFTGAVASDVLFDATAATSIVVVDDTNIDAVVPAHTAGLVDISVKGIALSNAIKFWDMSVPGTPTLAFDRGGASVFTFNGDPTRVHWQKRFGSLTKSGQPVELRSEPTIAALPRVAVGGFPAFGLRANGDPSAGSIGLTGVTTVDPYDSVQILLEDLWGGTNQNLGGTFLYVGNIRNISAASGSSVFAGDGIYYDSSQNRGGLMLDKGPEIRWMSYDGTFTKVARPIATSGSFATAVVRDITTSPGTPFMKITTDGVTWDGDAARHTIGSVGASARADFGFDVGGGGPHYSGLGRAMAWYTFQLTAQDITAFYGWYDAEFVETTFPYSDNPNGLWEGSYAGVPWTTITTNGQSAAAGDLTTLSGQVAPGVGSAVDGFTPATFDGSTQAFQNAIYTRLLIGDNANASNNSPFTIIVLAKGTGAVAPDATDYYKDPCLVCDNLGNMGLVFTTSGVRAGIYNAGSKNSPHIAQATNSWFMAAMRYDAANLDLRVNQTDASPTAVTTHDTFDNAMRFGYNYNNSKKFQGEVMTYLLFNRRLSNAELDAYYAHYQTKFPTMALP